MTPQSRIRRFGWFAALAICTALYLSLHLKVQSVASEVVRAERQIVRLEEQNLLLETEFLTRSSQIQLASWNRVDFGYTAPTADQFIRGDRQLAQFGTPRAVGAPEPIQLARYESGEGTKPFPQLVSPLTGNPIEADLLGQDKAQDGGRLAVTLAQGPVRIPIAAVAVIGGAGQ